LKGDDGMAEEVTCPLTKGENILIAVDGSRDSDFALEQAFSMANTCNSKLYAITVIDTYPKQIEGTPGMKEQMEKEAQSLLQTVEAKANEKNIPVETIVHWGRHPHEAIITESKDKGIDLIVLGTHGRTGLKKFFMGSVAQKVIGYARCPVMVVPSERE
jgi:nucleotide-binding universal stress UspA family protein